MIIKVGCCGFAKGMKKYFQEFSVIELQTTFYKLPKMKTAEKWREQAPENFIFCVKCFQGVSHPVKSPTWRRFGEIKEGKPENYGNLQPTKEVFDSWNKTLEICNLLQARICLIQTPRSFKDDEKNTKNTKKFFSKIKRGKTKIAVELRGWSDKNIKKLCKKFDLIDCRDPFKSLPTCFGKSKIAYLRLHGSYEKGRINYKHKYSKRELNELKSKINSLKVKETYVLFNNMFMYEDAKQFIKMIS